MKKFVLFLLIVLPLCFFGQRINFDLSKHILQTAEKDSLSYRFYLPFQCTTTIKFVNIFGGNEIVVEQDATRERGWNELKLQSDSLPAENAKSGVYYLTFQGTTEDQRNIEFPEF